MSVNLAQLITDLRTDEGVRTHPYRDTVGKITIGVGRNLTDNGLSDAEVNYLLQNDIQRTLLELAVQLPWLEHAPENVQRVVANLCFNMGWHRLSGFNTFLHLLQTGDVVGAADDLEGTAWFDQVGERGPRMVARLRSAA